MVNNGDTVPRVAADIFGRSRRYFMKNLIFKICQKKSQSKEKLKYFKTGQLYKRRSTFRVKSKEKGNHCIYGTCSHGLAISPLKARLRIHHPCTKVKLESENFLLRIYLYAYKDKQFEIIYYQIFKNN